MTSILRKGGKTKKAPGKREEVNRRSKKTRDSEKRRKKGKTRIDI